MKRWKSASNGVLRASARSTWASPRTLRRTLIPASWRSSAKAVLREESSRSPRPPSSGCSTQGRWPAPAIVTSCAPGTRLASSATSSGGVEPSWSPTMHRVGTAMRARGCGQIGVADGGAAGEIAFERRTGQHVAPAGELGGTLAMERWREPANEDRIGDASDPAGADGVDPLAPHRGGADLVGRVHQHQPRTRSGRAAGQRLGDHPADREAADERTAGAPRVEQPGRDPRRAAPSRKGRGSRRSGRGRACRSAGSGTGRRAWATVASHTRRSVPSEFTSTSSGASAGPNSS